jgi:hypothetical protein
MSEIIIQPIDRNGVLGKKVLVKKTLIQKFWEFWFGAIRNVLAILGLIWVISWFL